MTAMRVTARRCHWLRTGRDHRDAQQSAGFPRAVRWGTPAMNRGVFTGVPDAMSRPVWASYRNEMEVGGCTDCVLAGTTAAAVSAVLERGETKPKESVVGGVGEGGGGEAEEGRRGYTWG